MCLRTVFLVGCLSGQEILIVVFVLALVMGAGRLPQLGDALGRAVRNFKKSLKGENEIDVTPQKQVEAPKSAEDSESGAASR